MPLIPPSKIAAPASSRLRSPLPASSSPPSRPSTSDSSPSSAPAKRSPASASPVSKLSSRLASPSAVSASRRPTAAAISSSTSSAATPAGRVAAAPSKLAKPSLLRPVSAIPKLSAPSLPSASANGPSSSSSTPPRSHSRASSASLTPTDSPSSTASSSGIPVLTGLRLPSPLDSARTASTGVNASALPARTSSSAAAVLTASAVDSSAGSPAVVPQLSPASIPPLPFTATASVGDGEANAQLLAQQRQLEERLNALATEVAAWKARANLRDAEAAVEQAKREELEAAREERGRVQLAALQRLLDGLSESWKEEQLATVQREQTMQAQWETARTEDRQLVTASVSTAREEASKALSATVDSSQQQLAQLAAAQTASTVSLTDRLAEVQMQATAVSDAMRASVESLSSQLTPLDEEVGSIRGVLDSYNDDISALNERGEKAEEAVQGLKAECERLLTVTGDLSGRMRKAESDAIEARREGTAQQAELRELRQHLPSALHELAALKAEQEMALQQSVRRQHETDAALQRLQQRLLALGEVALATHLQHPLDAGAKAEEEQKRREEPADGAEADEEADTASRPPPASTISPASPPPTAPGGPSPSSAPSRERSHAGSADLSSTPHGRGQSSTSSSPSSDDLSSVFPSNSSNDADAQRQAGVFTSPTKVNSATSAMAWTINVKEGGGRSPAISRSASVSREHGTATPRSGSVSAGRSSGGAVGVAVGGLASERPSPVSSRSASISTAQPSVSGMGAVGTGQDRGSGVSGPRASVHQPGPAQPAAMASRSLHSELDAAAEHRKALDPPPPAHNDAQLEEDEDESY